MNADELARADACVRASLPRVDDALALIRCLGPLVEGRWLRDPYSGDEPSWLAPDPGLPGWAVLPPIVALELDVPDPGPPQFADPVFQRDWERREAEAARHRAPTLPSRVRRTGRLTVRRGDHALWQITYGADGLLRENMRSERPALAEWLGELPPSGVPVDVLAERLAAVDPSDTTPVRVFAPDPVPGGYGDVRWRALAGLRRALLGPQAATGGWVVVDGVRGSVRAAGATREEAIAAFEERVRGLEIVPEPPPPPPEPLDPVEPTSASEVREDGTTVLTASATLVFVPKTVLPWPPPGSRPCRALFPLPGPAELPPAWEGRGRLVGLVDADGRTGWAVRCGDERAGLLVGSRFATEATPEAVDGAVRAALAAREPIPAFFREHFRPDPAWTVHRAELRAGPDGALRVGGSGVGLPLRLDGFEAEAAQCVTWWGAEGDAWPNGGGPSDPVGA